MLRSATFTTRQLLCGSGGDLRTPTSQVCRAGGYESICQRHFDRIHRKTTRHARIRPLGGTRVSKTSHLPNYRRHNLAEAVLCIYLGHIAAAGVGLKPPKAYKSWFQLEEAPRYVLLQIINLMILYFWKTGENKIFHFMFIFVSLCILMISNY